MTEEHLPATGGQRRSFLVMGLGYLLLGLAAGTVQLVRGAGLNPLMTCLYLALGLFWLWYWHRSDRHPLP